jgi:hypothetical protein
MDTRILQIAKRIRELRIQKGYTSYETFGWDNEIPRIKYWRMEKGTNFTISSLLRILDTHNLTLAEFFEGFENEHKK